MHDFCYVRDSYIHQVVFTDYAWRRSHSTLGTQNPTDRVQAHARLVMQELPWSHSFCLGKIDSSGFDFETKLARNTGGGTAGCCSMHPIAAPARALGATVQVKLEPLETNKPTRNGARVYLAAVCDEASHAPEHYASVPLLGRTLSVTVDISAAKCGCNVAFYLSYLRGSPSEGQCDGDYYCDANEVCGLRCAEIGANLGASSPVCTTRRAGPAGATREMPTPH